MTHHVNLADKTLEVQLQQDQPFALNVSLRCDAGEMLALIGPSGSGKSTVLRGIAGLHKVQNGRISCAGQIWLDTVTGRNIAVQSRGVGFVFQHYGLFPHKSALDNVALAVPGKLTRKRQRAIAMSWLERTNMTGLEMHKPAQLSGGQRQRVALARALARNPSVLLLDEPFSAVDQQTRRRLYRELAQLRTGLNIPMILVTHDINEVQQLADSLCLIHRGETLQQGCVQSVINAPVSKSVAKLLGHQNLVTARVIDQSADATVYQLGDNEYLHGPPTTLAKGNSVTLLIAPTAITPQFSSNSAQATTNTLQGTIRDAVGMGDQWSLRVHLDNVTKSLRFRVAAHTVNATGLQAGRPIALTVLPEGIHAINNTIGRQDAID